MTIALAIHHPSCPAEMFQQLQSLPKTVGKGEMTLYPWITRIMGLAKFDKMPIYSNEGMMKQISPYVLPAGFLQTFPESFCRGPNDFEYQFFSFYCDVEDPAGTLANISSSLGKQVQIFVLDPGKVEYYEGWWGIVSLPWAPGGGESDNVHGDKIKNMVEELLVKKHFVYDWTDINYQEHKLHLKLISQIAEETLHTPLPQQSPAPAPSKIACLVV